MILWLVIVSKTSWGWGRAELEEKDDVQLLLWEAGDNTAFRNTKQGFLKNTGIMWCWIPLLHLWMWWWNKQMLWVSYKLTRLDLASWPCKFLRIRHGMHRTHSHSSAVSYNTGDATSLQMAQLQLIPHFLTVVIDQIWIITLVKLQKPNRTHAKFHQGSVINFYHFPISVPQIPKYVLAIWTRRKQQLSYKVTLHVGNWPLFYSRGCSKLHYKPVIAPKF